MSIECVMDSQPVWMYASCSNLPLSVVQYLVSMCVCQFQLAIQVWAVSGSFQQLVRIGAIIIGLCNSKTTTTRVMYFSGLQCGAISQLFSPGVSVPRSKPSLGGILNCLSVMISPRFLELELLLSEWSQGLISRVITQLL